MRILHIFFGSQAMGFYHEIQINDHIKHTYYNISIKNLSIGLSLDSENLNDASDGQTLGYSGNVLANINFLDNLKGKHNVIATGDVVVNPERNAFSGTLSHQYNLSLMPKKNLSLFVQNSAKIQYDNNPQIEFSEAPTQNLIYSYSNSIGVQRNDFAFKLTNGLSSGVKGPDFSSSLGFAYYFGR